MWITLWYNIFLIGYLPDILEKLLPLSQDVLEHQNGIKAAVETVHNEV